MNDKLKQAEQKDIIIKYSSELKQLVEKTYNDYFSKKDIASFNQSIEKHGEVLQKIKNDILLDNDQKDNLFQQYYNFCIDKCNEIEEVDKKTEIRRMIFHHLKEQQIFNDKSVAIDILKSKFKKEIEEAQKKYAEEMKKILLQQQLARQQQALEEGKQQKEKRQKQQQLSNTNAAQEQKQTPLDTGNIDANQERNEQNEVQQLQNFGFIPNGYKYSGNIFDQYAQYKQMNNADLAIRENNYGQFLNADDAQETDVKQTFNQDDFYRYKQINDVITNQTNEAIDGAYRFVQNEIKNSQMNAKKTKNDNIVNNKLNNNQVDANLLMQQLLNSKAKATMQKAYDKNDKNIHNSTIQNKDKIIDKNALNPNLSKE